MTGLAVNHPDSPLRNTPALYDVRMCDTSHTFSRLVFGLIPVSLPTMIQGSKKQDKFDAAKAAIESARDDATGHFDVNEALTVSGIKFFWFTQGNLERYSAFCGGIVVLLRASFVRVNNNSRFAECMRM